MDEQSDDDEGAADVQPRGRGRRTSAATTASEATPTPTHNRKRPRASSAAASSDERSNAGSDSTAAAAVTADDDDASDVDSEDDEPKFAKLGGQKSAAKTPTAKGKQPAAALHVPRSKSAGAAGTAACSVAATQAHGKDNHRTELGDVDLSKLSPHAQAKVALSRMSGVKEVVGREEERATIEGFLNTHIADRTPASMYISGKPGTGKTATVTAIIAAFCERSSRAAKVVNVNCMTETNPKAIFTRILDDLGERNSVGLSAAKAQALLEKKHLTLASKQSPMVVLVLDEIDQLETRDNSVLYTAFAWAHKAKSSVILVGIANGLDLTERVLPMLKGRGYSPGLLNFAPYSKEQLVAIVQGRIAAIPEVDGKPVLEKTSISLCAAKVTSVSGDLRNCLDICKRTVELAEKAKPGERQLGIMMSVFKSILGTDSAQRMRTLPMHQKVALCALYRLDLEGRECTVGKLHTMYREIASEKRLPTLRQGFYEMLTLMACSGFIELAAVNRNKTHESRQAKVKLRGVADDIKFAFAGDSFMVSLLNDPSKSKQMLPDSMRD